MLIGYHYTTIGNWYKIKVEGLIPYGPSEESLYLNINHQPLKDHFPKKVVPNNIWLWKYELNQEEHLGTLLFQLVTKITFEIVVLEVSCFKREILKIPPLKQGQKISLLHDGNIGNWVYHKGTPAILIKDRIPPNRIKLLHRYDFLRLTEK